MIITRIIVVWDTWSTQLYYTFIRIQCKVLNYDLITRTGDIGTRMAVHRKRMFTCVYMVIL